MQKAVPTGARSSPDSELTSHGATQQRKPPATESGHLSQLAAVVNRSPQVQAQRKLSDDLGNSPQVEAQRGLAEAVNAASPLSAQLVKGEKRAPSPNRTGLPDQLKSGVENLSGVSLDSVKVHYNSARPAQLNALAYAQGTDIHVAPGQEKHLPHETWHVVQQHEGRVKPTTQAKGVAINDDTGLEKEADVMGAKASVVQAVREKKKK